VQVANATRQKKFQGPVVGPIFSFVKVAPGKEQYASVAEHALGIGVLDRFIVTNDHDNKVMRQIRHQAGCTQDCGIFQISPRSTNRRFNIPEAPPIDGIETVASVLAIENDIVVSLSMVACCTRVSLLPVNRSRLILFCFISIQFNCLVDNARIEQKAIARDRKYSEQQLLVRNGNKNEIRGGKLKEVYFLPKGDYWTVRNSSLAAFSNDRLLRSTIGVDKSAAIEEARREEAQLKEELKVRKAEESKLHHDHSRYQKEWNNAKKAVQNNDILINSLSDKLDEIKNEMETSANVTIDTTEFEEDVQQVTEQIEKFKEREQDLVAQKAESEPRVQEIKSRLDEITVRNAKVVEDLKAAESEMSQFLETQTQRENQIQRKREKLDKYKKIVSEHERHIETMTEEREAALKKARKLHFRFMQRKGKESNSDELPASDVEVSQHDPTVEDLEAIQPLTVPHEMEYYEARIKKTRKQLDAEKSRLKVSQEDPAVAFENYTTAKAQYVEQLEAIQNREATIQELQLDIKRRKKRWQQFRKHLSKSTNMKFDEMLQLNKYSGSLKFEHDDGTLDLAVAKSSQGATKDVKALRFV